MPRKEQSPWKPRRAEKPFKAWKPWSRELWRPGREPLDWFRALVCAILSVVLVFTFAIRLVGVSGYSMVPTLQDGDRLLLLNSWLSRDYRRGDIIVLRKESLMREPIVKRVIATEGQTVDIDFAAGSVFVDGQLLDEPYINEQTYTDEGVEFPLTLREGELFVMGDNRNRSTDSRDLRIGSVEESCVIGRAVLLLYPGEDIGTGRRDFRRIGPLERA